MNWPQWVMAAVLLLGLIARCVAAVRNQKITSTEATMFIGLWIAYWGAFAALLRAGGFW